jgi:hypothetical protein
MTPANPLAGELLCGHQMMRHRIRHAGNFWSILQRRR